MRTADFAIVTSGDMGGVINSSPIWLDQMWGCGIQSVFTGSPAGSLKLQVSADAGYINPDGTASGITNWSDYTGSSQTISAAGNYAYDVTQTSFRWVRLVWTPTSGAGSLTARAIVKG